MNEARDREQPATYKPHLAPPIERNDDSHHTMDADLRGVKPSL